MMPVRSAANRQALSLHSGPDPVFVREIAVVGPGTVGLPIQVPIVWANLSLSAERIVIQRGPGVISRPAAPWLLSAVRNGPAPLKSLPGRTAASAHTPWFGVPPSTTCETLAAPPPLAM